MTKDLFDFNQLTASMRAFKEAFDELKETTRRLQDQLRDDARTRPYEIVTQADTHSSHAHQCSLDSISRFHFPEEGELPLPFLTGVLCVSPASIDLTTTVNAARCNLKKAAQLLREKIKQRKRDINQVIKHVCMEPLGLRSPSREKAFNTYLKQLGLSRIDLTHCYAQIRVLPTHTRSVSWSWNRRHSASQKFTQADVMRLIEQEPDENTKDTLIDLVAQVPSDHILIRKRFLQPTLIANLVYHDWDSGTDYRRKTVNVSGILLSPDNELPMLKWREKPSVGVEAEDHRIPRYVAPELRLPSEPHIKKYALFIRKSHDDDPIFR